ncbi:hypothetical protein [Vibrio sp. Evd11]|uniref:hypothetical protein n=1 Tax=Vibrio sp. Evd11 TaxID=1207404 RepID=UPI000EFD790F|nr:hypothetical protein [Vibrio sp. Evd11]
MSATNSNHQNRDRVSVPLNHSQALHNQPYSYEPQDLPTQSSNNHQMSKADRASVQLKFITNAALQVELTSNKDGIPTIDFEQTKIKKVGGVRQGDWGEKIHFQINPNTELKQLIDFVTNRIHEKTLTFKYHGKMNNKSLNLIKNDDGSLMFNLSEGNKHYSGVVQPTGITQILTLMFKAYSDRFRISIVDAISILNKSPCSELPKL